MTAIIRTFDLCKRYGDVVAIDQLSLEVRSGEIYGFLGLNGAGKTTTIRTLLGLVRPSAGSVEVLGNQIRPGSGLLLPLLPGIPGPGPPDPGQQ